MRANGRSALKLAFGGRHTCVIFIAVIGTQERYINIASLHLIKVELLWSLIGRRDILEQKHLKEAADQWVVVDVVAQSRSLCSEFALHAANEDTQGQHS